MVEVGDKIICTVDDIDGAGGVKVRNAWLWLDEYEPVAVEQQQLRIEAGRCYRTRDGRKVGPMREADPDEAWEDYRHARGAFVATAGLSENDGSIYAANGTWLTSEGDDRRDIIAEWPADADNDNAANPKFKVGDRVHVTQSPYELLISERDGIIESIAPESYRAFWLVRLDNYGGTLSFNDEELSLVAPATSDEPDVSLSVTVSADTSALDAEIDRVKRKLKKLKKRARKLGIRLDYSELRDVA